MILALSVLLETLKDVIVKLRSLIVINPLNLPSIKSWKYLSDLIQFNPIKIKSILNFKFIFSK